MHVMSAPSAVGTSYSGELLARSHFCFVRGDSLGVAHCKSLDVDSESCTRLSAGDTPGELALRRSRELLYACRTLAEPLLFPRPGETDAGSIPLQITCMSMPWIASRTVVRTLSSMASMASSTTVRSGSTFREPIASMILPWLPALAMAPPMRSCTAEAMESWSCSVGILRIICFSSAWSTFSVIPLSRSCSAFAMVSWSGTLPTALRMSLECLRSFPSMALEWASRALSKSSLPSARNSSDWSTFMLALAILSCTAAAIVSWSGADLILPMALSTSEGS
mmetsp:Transcript_80861/g.187740  ORF Transcript_80861/g.187740 Transcript_80861/m.187740 type:complete len:280 (+) Transcript_80861:170-1009(+)